jgi:hypothetical protein
MLSQIKSQKRHTIGALFVLLFAAIGVYLLAGSHASTPYISLNADKGTLANGAVLKASSAASDGNYVILGNGTGGSGGGGSGSGTVNTSPTGPTAPSGGWSVAYADGFTQPIGTSTGQDNTWFPNRPGGSSTNPCVNAPGDNSNEMEVYNCNKVAVDSQGLELSCAYSPGVATGKNYVCGTVRQQAVNGASGYKQFAWKPAQGETWAFEVVGKFPPNTGEEDVGWWSYDAPWTDEFDFFESWGWNDQPTSGYTTTTTGIAWLYSTPTVIEGYKQFWPNASNDPSLAFHRYTTVVYPNNTFSFYIDGILQTGGTIPSNGLIGPPGGTIKTPNMGLVLQYALRNPKYSTGFTSGSRTFTVRSAAVYQDAGHAGKDIVNGGLAPGTAVK